MNRIQFFALLYILVLGPLLYGYAIGRFQVFPYQYLESLVQEYEAFAQGDPMEKDSSVVDKLANDMGFIANRWIYEFPEVAARGTAPLDLPADLQGDSAPRVYIHPDHRAGYRVVIGIQDTDDTFWGGMLLSPEGEALHAWRFSTDHLGRRDDEGWLESVSSDDWLKNLYGVHVFPDGSVIFNMQEEGNGLVKVDACSNIVWSSEGAFHHVVSPGEEGTFWSFAGGLKNLDQDIVELSIDTGEILRTIDMTAVREANPTLRIWDLMPSSFADRAKIRSRTDMAHGNDIEPLPSHLAEQFPQFAKGNLVISYAATNLIFVLDPDTLEVKWWRVGAGDWQHDPDWEEGGVITLFNNNSRRLFKQYSDIVTVDPRTMAHTVAVEGEPLGVMSNINGRHQLTEFGTRLVTSSTQGWAFETDASGDIVFSYLNTRRSDETRALHLAEAFRFSEDYFKDEFWTACD